MRGPARRPHLSLAIISVTVQLWTQVFWVISVYFNIRNTLPKFCPFLLGHSVYIFLTSFFQTFLKTHYRYCHIRLNTITQCSLKLIIPKTVCNHIYMRDTRVCRAKLSQALGNTTTYFVPLLRSDVIFYTMCRGIAVCTNILT